MPPRISVLIPAFNEEAQLPLTLASVRESFAEIGETAYEVIVCDNNSTDATTPVAQQHGARVVFEPHNQIARARNTAAERSAGEWLIFLDADTRLNPEVLRTTLRLLQAGGVCGGGSTVRFDIVDMKPLHVALTALWNTISVRLALAAGSYVFCLRQAWEAVGGFDQTIYAGEEIFFSRKLKRWGRERQLKFTIIAGSPIITSSRKLEWYGQWKMLGHILRLIRPGAIKKRENCGMWYERPVK
jgi:glycosyltransferase involved in cell wall biosynthesis